MGGEEHYYLGAALSSQDFKTSFVDFTDALDQEQQ
jgi:hypothetical protein